MTFSEPFMTRITAFVALCIIAVAIAVTDLGLLGAVLFLAGYVAGLVTPRSE